MKSVHRASGNAGKDRLSSKRQVSDTSDDSDRVRFIPGNLFLKAMRNHENMRAINATMCLWLIASFGKNFADWDNVDAAMLMLSHVIVAYEIGGYTDSTFQLAVRGYQNWSFGTLVIRIFLSN
jgi:hypothetical protein